MHAQANKAFTLTLEPHQIGGSCEKSADSSPLPIELSFHNPEQPKEPVRRDSSCGNRPKQHTVSTGPTCRQSGLMEAQEGLKFSTLREFSILTTFPAITEEKQGNLKLYQSHQTGPFLSLFLFLLPVYKLGLWWKLGESITLSQGMAGSFACREHPGKGRETGHK